jgi:tetratricopeptide (TPR) repeat protein
VALITAAYFIFRAHHRYPAIVFGSLFFLINIIFLLQVFSVGLAWSADRFTYIPYFGFFFLAAWLADLIVRQNRGRQTTVITIFSLFSLMCLFLTNARCKDWYSGETLWTDVISQYREREALPYVNRGVAFTLEGRWPEALDDFNKALAIDKDCKSVFANRAIVYGNMGQPQKAIDDFSRVIGSSPTNANAWFNRGVSYVNIGKNDLAIADFTKAVELKSDYLAAYLNIGFLYMQAKEYEQALKFSIRGLQVNPAIPDLNRIAGDCYFEMGDNAKAGECYYACLVSDENNLDALLGMAVVLSVKNDKAGAEGYIRRAQNINQKLSQGMQGLEAMEKEGFLCGEKKREALSKIF